MGFWRDFFNGAPSPAEIQESAAAQFAVDAQSIDPAVFGLTSYSDPIAPAPRISRREAIQVPAVKHARDLICGSLGELPLQVIDSGNVTRVNDLLDQPERYVPRSVTMTRTVEDLLFEGVAWWRVTDRAFDGYPRFVERLDPSRVAVDDVQGRVYVDGAEVDYSDLIQFHSPNDPLLVAGSRAIRTCLKLDAAAAMYADEPLPTGYFTPTEGADPADDEDVVALLNGWNAARKARSTAYVPAALQYQAAQFNAEQIQLAEQRQHAVLEIARAAGVDPEELGVSTTSRTYANMQERRKWFIDFTVGPFMKAIQDRLSMGDVTKRGYSVRFNLSDFLRSDDKTRMETYDIALRVGAIAPTEIRDLEGKPPLALPASTTPEASVSASNATFSEPEVGLRLDATAASAATFSVDAEKRTITGLAVPFGKVAKSGGKSWQFDKGVINFTDVSRVKLLAAHDWKQAIGRAVSLEETDEGLVATFKVARGAEGDRALSLAEDGVWDGLSGGFAHGMTFETRDGINYATSAPLAEISLTPCPAYDDARVTAVAASSDITKENPMTDEVTPQTAQPVTLDVLTDALKSAFPQGPEPVRPTAQFEVKEELPYRFDGIRGGHSFVDDMRDAQHGDHEARTRLEKFGEVAFAVTTSNVSTLNPTKNRPELYVPNLSYSRPLWDSVSTGTVEDRTPFTVPKFSSATGLVGNHTEGVEPTPGAFTATSQTITPGPMSGKIEINREVLDAGGSPQVDGIVFGEMINAYYEAIEAKIAAALQAVPTAELNLASATGATLVDALTNYYAGLQFVRGGNRYTGLVLDGTLFPALVNAADSTGRKLLPVMGPTNAQGTVDGAFDRIQIGNQTGRAAWALGTGNAARSFSFVPSSVYCWASAPKQFRFEYQVKSVDLAIWGYAATAVLRDSDVKPIDYTTADA